MQRMHKIVSKFLTSNCVRILDHNAAAALERVQVIDAVLVGPGLLDRLLVELEGVAQRTIVGLAGVD